MSFISCLVTIRERDLYYLLYNCAYVCICLQLKEISLIGRATVLHTEG